MCGGGEWICPSLYDASTHQDPFGSTPSGLAIYTHFKGDGIALPWRDAGRQAANVEENVFAARFRLYEAKAFVVLKQLYYSFWHSYSPFHQN
jgi:hypothetical protein